MELRTHWGCRVRHMGCTSDVTEVKGHLLGAVKFWSP